MNVERPNQSEPPKPTIKERVETYVNQRITDPGLKPQFKPIIIDSVVPVLEATDPNQLWQLALDTDDEAMDSHYGLTLLSGEHGPLGFAWAYMHQDIAYHGFKEKNAYATFRERIAIRIASLKLGKELDIKEGDEKTYKFKSLLVPVVTGVTTTLKNFSL